MLYSGDLVTLDFLLNETMDMKVNSIIKTGIAQTFNSICKAESFNSGFVIISNSNLKYFRHIQ